MTLRGVVRTFMLSGCAIATGCGVSASATGLTPAFVQAARDAHNYLKSDLIPRIGTPGFSTTLAAARAKTKLLEAKMANDTDKGVWLILTMAIVKTREMSSMGELTAVMDGPSAEVQAATRDVAAERDQCMTEAEGWLSGSASRVAALNAGPCLQQSRRAAAILGR